MTFYSGLAAVATRLLTDKGQQLTFTRKTTTVSDPVQGKRGTTTSTYAGFGAAFDYNRTEIDGQAVQRGDIRLLLNAVTTVPIIDDTTIIDSVTYRVMSVRPTSPGGTVVMYELQLRK